MLAVVLGWVLWHSSVTTTPEGDAWTPAQRLRRVESVRACVAARAEEMARLRSAHVDAVPVTSPTGLLVREGQRATIHLYYCLPSHARLD